ncbi:MAG: PspC domain-containing protein [Sphingomicrobium sp.]
MNAMTQIVPATAATAAAATANSDPTPLPLRAHNILGVCEGLGEDFGISPLWFRVPFGASVLISPLWAVAAYLGFGLVVLASRLIFPKTTVITTVATTVVSAANRDVQLPIAA